MGKYLIAGPPGSGKSSVIRELQSKNITAYEADSYPGMTLLEDNNGNHVPWPSGAIDWKKYQWNWQLDVVRKMLETKKNVFIGGLTSNIEEISGAFDIIFLLMIDDEVQEKRILQRKDKDYGKDPKQLTGEFHYRSVLNERYAKFDNLLTIDATQPLKTVVEQILKNSGVTT